MERYCEMCKNPFFADANQQICGACREKDKQASYLEKVVSYVRENKGTTIAQVITETGVPYDMLKLFIKEKRVDLVLDHAYDEEVRKQKMKLYNQLVSAGKTEKQKPEKSTKGKDNLSYQMFK